MSECVSACECASLCGSYRSDRPEPKSETDQWCVVLSRSLTIHHEHHMDFLAVNTYYIYEPGGKNMHNSTKNVLLRKIRLNPGVWKKMKNFYENDFFLLNYM